MMVKIWFDLMSLAMESQQVILLRCLKLARGGPAAATEARRMATEKLAVAGHAAAGLMTGGTPAATLQLCRVRVRANRRRLSR
jgi:hypothetical protein